MILSDGYRKRIFELSGLILENRIEKLRKEKYPEDIINFAIEFAKLTTRDVSNEENVLRNQYIPWIAQEVKKNPNIVNDKSKLDVIVYWIKNANYPPINTNENFDSVFEKAKAWLDKKNIDPSSGQRLEGGRVIKTYPNGLKWVRVTNTNWCMNVGEKYGWCFSDPGRAETFVGLGAVTSSNQGYMLMGAKDKPLLAVQYNPETKVIDDIQAPFNKPASQGILRYGFDLFKNLGAITDIKGHQNNFWKVLDANPELKNELTKIPTVQFSIENKLTHRLLLTPEERATLDLDTLLKYHIPLTPEEIASLPIETKLKYNIPLSDDDKKFLKTSQDMFVAKLWKATRSRSRAYEKIFTDEDFAGYKDYMFDYEEKSVKLDIDDTEFEEKFSGLEENDRSIYNMVNSYDYNEEVDSSEIDYMYNFLDDENKKSLKYIAIQLGMPDYDFEKEKNLANFLKDYTDIRIEDDFRVQVSYGWERSAKKAVNDVVESEQKFKYKNGYLILPFKEIYKFVAEHPEENIKSFNDLKKAKINGEISVDSEYSDSRMQVDDEASEEINNMFKKNLEEFIDKIKYGEIDFATGIQRAQEILRNLRFKKFEDGGYYHGYNYPANAYAVKKGGRVVFVTGFDFHEEKFDVHILDFGNVKTIRKNAKPKKVLDGKISYDRLADYVYQYELFENMGLRNIIREIIAEDFRYLYDRNTFTPPVEVARAVTNAINVVSNNRMANNSGGNEGSGIQKAKSLANREPMNHAQLKRMKSFFDNNEGAVRNERSQGKNASNSGIIQSWELWGGDAGKQWVERQISSVQSANKTSKKIRNPEDGVRTKTLMDPHNTRIRK